MAEIKKKTLRLTTLAVLGALAIVLSALENLIPPLPMMPPGAKLGLSNIVTMFAAGTFGLIPSLAIALLKALFRGRYPGRHRLADELGRRASQHAGYGPFCSV